MTTTFRARVDNGVLVPQGPVDLPEGAVLEVRVSAEARPSAGEPPLVRLARLLEQSPANPDSPTDAAAEHDHYLYGTPKRGER